MVGPKSVNSTRLKRVDSKQECSNVTGSLKNNYT